MGISIVLSGHDILYKPEFRRDWLSFAHKVTSNGLPHSLCETSPPLRPSILSPAPKHFDRRNRLTSTTCSRNTLLSRDRYYFQELAIFPGNN
jgi:hypothetical protein